MARYRGSTFKKARRYGFSILENDKEFSKGKKEQQRQDNMANVDQNYQTTDYNYMKNKKYVICMV